VAGRHVESQRRHDAGCRKQQFRSGFHAGTVGCQTRKGNAVTRSRFRRKSRSNRARLCPPWPQVEPQVRPK
jgi:hypothetical protein